MKKCDMALCKKMVNDEERFCQACKHRIRNYKYLAAWIGRNVLGHPDDIESMERKPAQAS